MIENLNSVSVNYEKKNETQTREGETKAVCNR